MGRPFLILGLPRSRTAWLARFLTFGPWECSHEHARHLRSMEDVESWLRMRWVGSAETAVGPFWRLVPPEVRVMVVRRPVGEVVASLLREGAPGTRDSLTCLIGRLDKKLAQVVKRREGVLEVTYAALAEEATCAALFRHCLEVEMPREWWRLWQGVRLQGNVQGEIAYIHAHLPQLSRMAAEAKQTTLRKWVPQRWRPLRPGPLRLGPEKFDSFVIDGIEAFQAHARLVERPWGDALKLNWALAGTMAARGDLFVVSAREGTRLVGYAVVMLGADLLSSRVVASLVFLFAQPAQRSLGLRLAREAFREARARGASVGWLFRTRDSSFSWRLDILAARLGAEEISTTYELPLKGTR